MSEEADKRLLSAMSALDHAGVRSALAEGADPNASVLGSVALGGQDWPILCVAAFWANGPIAEALLDAGADIDATCPHGLSPLRYACEHHKADMALLLAARGANLDGRSPVDGLTPFMAAAIRSQAVAIALLDAGADPSRPDAAGRGWEEVASEALGFEAKEGDWRSLAEMRGRILAVRVAVDERAVAKASGPPKGASERKAL